MPEIFRNFARIWGAEIKQNSQVLGYGILRKIGDRASKTYDEPITPVGKERVEAPNTTHTLCLARNENTLLQRNSDVSINGGMYRILQIEPIYYKKDVIFYYKIALFFIEPPVLPINILPPIGGN